MAFFGAIKESTKAINDQIEQLKKAKRDFSFYPELQRQTPNFHFLEPEEIKNMHPEMEVQIRNTRIATSKVKVNLKYKQDIARSYFLDMEDLFLDIKDELRAILKRLDRLGYPFSEIVEDINKVEEESPSGTPEAQEAKGSSPLGATPVLRLTARERSLTPLLNLVSKVNDATPTLLLEEKGKYQNPARGSSPVPVLQKAKVPSAYSEVARKLDFE